MPSARTARRPLLRLLATASAVAAGLAGAVGPTAVAAADEPAGTTVVGELLQAWPESERPGAGETTEPLSWVHTTAGDSVRITSEDVEGVPAGSTVQVTVGGKVDDAAAADGFDPAHTVTGTHVLQAPDADPVAPAAGPTNQVTVALVAPGGVAHDRVDLGELVRTVDGPVADFWSEQSGGGIRVGVTASHTWIDTVADCSDPTELWNEAADAVKFEPGDGKHLLLYLSGAATGCAYALAQVGSAPASGGMLYVSDTLPSVIAHELGHNFGLGHSSGLQCDSAVEGGTCRTAAYRDYYDVMGASWTRMGSLNAPQAASLHLIPAGQQQSLSVRDAATTVTLAPLGDRTGTRALRLTDAEGADYWLEYRAATGRDAWLAARATNPFVLDAGVLLRRAQQLSTAVPDTSLLLDGTPAPAADWEADLHAALPVGVPILVSDGDFTVVVQSVGAAGAVLAVTPSPPVAAAAAPAPRAATPAPAVLPGAGPTAGTATAPDAAGFWTPPNTSVRAPRPTPVLASAADSTSGVSLLLPLAGAVLAGSVVLVVCMMRRFRAR